jgi:SAM-dependent methyltransferase
MTQPSSPPSPPLPPTLPMYSDHNIRTIEKVSIEAFLTHHRQYLKGRILDYGCGAYPYRALCEASKDTKYVGCDIQLDQPSPQWRTFPFDTILCTQVIQYTDDPVSFIPRLFSLLKHGGHLVLTYPTNWDEVDNDCYVSLDQRERYCDRWRFTKLGMEDLLIRSRLRYSILHHDLRAAALTVDGFRFPLGYGLIVQKGV